MDPFQSLPAHIIEQILKQLPDLPTLHSLHNASPSIALVLHQDWRLTTSVIEAIITHPHTPHMIQFIIRTIALLSLQSQSCSKTESTNNKTHNSLLPTTLEGFIEPLRIPNDGKTRLSSFGDVPLTKSLHSAPDPLQFSSRFLCRLLALSTYVRYLTHTILHSLHERCLSLRPSHPADSKHRYYRSRSLEAWFQHSPGEPGPTYQLADMGPHHGQRKCESHAVFGGLFYTLRQGKLI